MPSRIFPSRWIWQKGAGFKLRGAELIGTILQEAIDAGIKGDNYFPVIAKHIGKA